MKSSGITVSRVASAVLLVLGAACSGSNSIAPVGQNVNLAGREGHARPAGCVSGYTGTPSSPLQVIDKSGLKPPSGWPGIYVLVNNSTEYMTGSGQLVGLPKSGTIPAIAVSSMCSNFAIPTTANRIFIAYGSGLSVGDFPAPNLRGLSVLFDWVENAPQYGSGSGVGPNINADQFALPIEGMAKDSAGNYYVLGFNNKYSAIISDFETGPSAQAGWENLVKCGPVPSRAGVTVHPFAGSCPSGKMVVRVLQPYFAAAGGDQSGAFQGFPDFFYDKTQKCGSSQCDYMQVIGNFYHTQNQEHPGEILYVPYITQVNGTSCVSPPGNGTACPTYTVDYDSSSGKFTFTLHSGSDKTYPKTVVFGSGKSTHPLTSGDIWGNANLPPLPKSASITQQVTFYLAKYFQVDLNRGLAMVTNGTKTVYHPLLPACMASPTSPICYPTNYYVAGAQSNVYAYNLHHRAIQNWWHGQQYGTTWPWTTNEPGGAYGFPYDDWFSQDSETVIPYRQGVATIKQFILCVQPMVSGASGVCSNAL